MKHDGLGSCLLILISLLVAGCAGPVPDRDSEVSDELDEREEATVGELSVVVELRAAGETESLTQVDSGQLVTVYADIVLPERDNTSYKLFLNGSISDRIWNPAQRFFGKGGVHNLTAVANVPQDAEDVVTVSYKIAVLSIDTSDENGTWTKVADIEDSFTVDVFVPEERANARSVGGDRITVHGYVIGRDQANATLIVHVIDDAGNYSNYCASPEMTAKVDDFATSGTYARIVYARGCDEVMDDEVTGTILALDEAAPG